MTLNNGTTVMSVNGLKTTLMIATALKSIRGADGEEIAHGLPAGYAATAYAVDEYPACPTSWMNGSDKASSYFLAIEPGNGLWLNFNQNASHTHDVAIVTSIQKINAVSGLKHEGLALEQYRSRCPKHDVEFKQDRFCEECGFSWPGQNYIATTGTRQGLLWLDGFRSADGKVRQWIVTEEEMRGVAAQKIGDERVWAIGVAFYLSKEAAKLRPTHQSTMRPKSGICGASVASDGCVESSSGEYAATTYSSTTATTYNSTIGSNIMRAFSLSGESNDHASLGVGQGSTSRRGVMRSAARAVETKKLEIGAGALIKQQIDVDPKPIDYWQEEPAGLIYINYCLPSDVEAIIAAGRREEKREGQLDGLVVGN